MALKVSSTIHIDESEIEERFIRAAGPGGQNVNKVATAVQLRFNVRENQTLSESVKHRLIKLAGRKMTEDGILLIEARRFRTQLKNRLDARARLSSLVQEALKKPKTRIPTNTPLSAELKRLERKKKRSRIKSTRRDAQNWDD